MIKFFLGSITTSIVILIIFINWRYKNERELFKEAVMFTVNYRNKYGEYPSYWLWNKVYEYPDANIDSLKLIQDSIFIQFKKLK